MGNVPLELALSCTPNHTTPRGDIQLDNYSVTRSVFTHEY